MVCHVCGEPLRAKEQSCSHCGQRRGKGARAGRALPSPVWLSVLGIAAVVPLLLQCYWRRQADAWMEAGKPIQLLASRPPPGPGIRPWNEAIARSRQATRTAERNRRRRLRRSGDDGDRTRVARVSEAESGRDGTSNETRLSLSVAPQEVTTFVYLNGGTLLGRAPLHETPLRPGRHRLVLWAPAIRGRATYSVTLEPGQHARVSTELAAGPHS
jgi:hypothetical protein